jgi:serine-type D-Ala-D-Ala endopeptidase (penicillin-binding protein 7)
MQTIADWHQLAPYNRSMITAVHTQRLKTLVLFAFVFLFVVGNVTAAQAATQPNVFSQKALLVDAASNEVLFSRNAQSVTPIASITKVMTAIVVLDAKQPLDELIEISIDDFDVVKGSRSRLRMGVSLTRREMLTLALMSSENRAAHALCRAYPGGLGACISAMNQRAKALGMNATSFADPTGLSPNNLSTAQDLIKLVRAADAYPLLSEMSVQHGQDVELRPTGRMATFGNSNGLVRNPKWNIALQKTGYIAEAGNCVVMALTLANKKVWLVLLDAAGRYSRFGDAHRVKTWMETGEVLPLPKPTVKKTKAGKRGAHARAGKRKRR